MVYSSIFPMQIIGTHVNVYMVWDHCSKSFFKVYCKISQYLYNLFIYKFYEVIYITIMCIEGRQKLYIFIPQISHLGSLSDLIAKSHQCFIIMIGWNDRIRDDGFWNIW